MATIMERVVRRETHSPRSAAVVLVLIIVSVVALWVATELILHMAGGRALLATPGAIMQWLVSVPDLVPRAAVVAGAAAVAVIGAVLVVLSVAPGRRARHRLDVTGVAVADNSVIASAVAEEVRRSLDMSAGDVVVGVGHRALDVTARTSAGRRVTAADVGSAAQAALAACRIPPLRVHARVVADQRGQE
ncbi:DNA/RNA endonuclease G [Microbacterium nymphoidis]|uniref:DNA/RNA endonuclease G n=1 Tax=Microbacterium nymphoidis TaxID=2898586 RepID=UPI001E4FE936|nr:DNA/RNA endonuclease G [Microbacterium nymphoidis]MCD2499111.1 DNA/RNA endonuclease G [Microbacterium nymphoidis]